MAGITKEEQKRRAELLAKGLKVCFKCGRELPVEQFGKDNRSKDGLYSWCKECKSKYDKQYNEQYYQTNKQYYQQYNQQYNNNHKQQRQQYNKQYNNNHKQEIAQYNKYYYENNKQKEQQRHKQYHQTPQGQVVRFNGYVKRRKREEEQGAGITKEQWLEMMNYFDWKCAYSGILVNTKNNRSIDHIVPLVKGGEHEVWNLVPMDRSLNTSKKDKDMMEWYTAQEFYSKEKLDKILAWQQYAYNKWSNTEEAQ